MSIYSVTIVHKWIGPTHQEQSADKRKDGMVRNLAGHNRAAIISHSSTVLSWDSHKPFIQHDYHWSVYLNIAFRSKYFNINTVLALVDSVLKQSMVGNFRDFFVWTYPR